MGSGAGWFKKAKRRERETPSTAEKLARISGTFRHRTSHERYGNLPRYEHLHKEEDNNMMFTHGSRHTRTERGETHRYAALLSPTGLEMDVICSISVFIVKGVDKLGQTG